MLAVRVDGAQADAQADSDLFARHPRGDSRQDFALSRGELCRHGGRRRAISARHEHGAMRLFRRDGQSFMDRERVGPATVILPTEANLEAIPIKTIGIDPDIEKK